MDLTHADTNLTFRMMKRTSNKRKNEDTVSVSREIKKAKEVDKSCGVFMEDRIPECVFPIGDSVFVLPTTFRGSVSVHIRRYKKYGSSYYPTSEGVTLQPWWMEYIFGRKKLPQSSDDLRGGIFLPENQIQISSTDFVKFTFKRMQSTPNGEEFFKSITISDKQWTEILNKYDAINVILLDHVFCSMDLLNTFSDFAEGPIAESIPESLDMSLGTAYLMQVLQNVLCDELKGKGLKQPEVFDCGELWANRTETFNSAALSLDIRDIAHTFYHSLWKDEHFLLMKPYMYATQEFFKNLRLDIVLREARNVLCPPNASEYFEDV